MFSNLVVGVDGRAGGRDATALTRLLAEARRAPRAGTFHDANLMLGGGLALALAAHRDASERLLALEGDNASPKAEVMTCAATSIGRGLHELAEREDADLLVVGSRNRGLVGRVFLNDDTRASPNGASCAVAIAPRGYAENADGLVNIGVGYDGSPESRRALGALCGLAARHGSPVRALSVVSIHDTPYGEPINDNWPELDRKLADDALNSLTDVGDVTRDPTHGDPSEELVRFSVEVRPLIVGSRGHRPLGRLLNGSTANHLAPHASPSAARTPAKRRHGRAARAAGEHRQAPRSSELGTLNANRVHG